MRDKLIEAMFRNETLYIKDTGVKVSIDYFGSDLSRDSGFRTSRTVRDYLVKVEFETAPSMKALKLCTKYHIKKNSHTKKMEMDAEVELDNLSLYPFETKGAKLLYGKEKDKKS